MPKKSTAAPVETAPRFDPRAFVEHTATLAAAVRDVLISSPYALASSTTRALNGAVTALQGDAEAIAAEMGHSADQAAEVDQTDAAADKAAADKAAADKAAADKAAADKAAADKAAADKAVADKAAADKVAGQ